jgi:hypothetical protein
VATIGKIQRISRDAGRLPISHTQEERLLGGGGHISNNIIVTGLRLDGVLRVGDVAASIADLARRHENLRATFDISADHAHVRIGDEPARLHYEEVDGHVPDGRRVDVGLEIIADHLQRPFDLADGPLFRACLIRVDETCHLLGMSVDHVIADGRSRELLVRDFARIHRSKENGKDPELPELPVQFVDFAAWERNHLTGRVLDRLTDYWKKTLSGIDPIPDSGLRDPAAEGGTPGVGIVRYTTPPALKRRLDRRSGGTERASSYGIVSAAVKAAVRAQRIAWGSRIDPDDVAFFASAGNRLSPEIADAFGFFATPIVFRTDLSGDPTVREVLERETKVVFSGLRHQQLPHSLVIKHVNPAQYGSRYRVEQDGVPPYINFDFGNETPHVRSGPAGSSGGENGTLRINKIGLPVVPVPRSGIRVLGSENESAIGIEVRFRTDLYTRPALDAFIAHVHCFLEAVASSPESRLSELTPERATIR